MSAADVDIKFEQMSMEELRGVLDGMGLAMRVDAKPAFTYFFAVGCDPDIQLEGHMMMRPVMRPEDMESPANALMVDLAEMTLLDPTGLGLEDARARVWRIPPDADRDEWIDQLGGPRRLWRMLKFRLRGYRVPPADVELIYKKFASAAGRGEVRASDYRNLINQVPDPSDAVRLMVEDAAAGRGAAGDVNAVLAALLSSDEVWKRVKAQGNVPFQTVCRGIREREIAKRAEQKAAKRAERAEKKTAKRAEEKTARKRSRRRAASGPPKK